MPIRPCPRCSHPTPRMLEECSKDAFVYYYRCGACGNVWSIQKQDPDVPIRSVTKPQRER